MSVYVTDTHPLLWYATRRFGKLSARAKRAFDRASRGDALIWVPAMALWEAGLLNRIMRIRFEPSYRVWAERLARQAGFAVAPMDLEIIQASLDFEPNSDLFDVSIVATAIDKDLPLITRDRSIVESGRVRVHW